MLDAVLCPESCAHACRFAAVVKLMLTASFTGMQRPQCRSKVQLEAGLSQYIDSCMESKCQRTSAYGLGNSPFDFRPERPKSVCYNKIKVSSRLVRYAKLEFVHKEIARLFVVMGWTKNATDNGQLTPSFDSKLTR